MRRLIQSRPVQLTAAVLLILVSPLVGAIPGPGGVFVFAGGLILLLRNSRMARRQFARAKKRWPRLGGWLDRGLRRESARRRRALEQERSR
jgi:predicted small integral membrane protein